MKKKVMMVLCIALVALVIVGCGNKDKINYGKIIDQGLDSISFPTKVTENIAFLESTKVDEVDVIFTYRTNNDAISSIGVVTRKAEDTVVRITVSGAVEGQSIVKRKGFEVTVIKKAYVQEVLDIGDVESNKVLKNALDEELGQYTERLNNSNYLSMKTSIDTNGSKTTSSFKLIDSPINIEIYEDDSSLPEIIREENGNIFTYELSPYGSEINRKFSCSVDDFTKTDISGQEGVNDVLGINIDPSKASYKKENNRFTIRSYFKDGLSEEEKNSILLIFGQLGIEPSYLYNSIVTITIDILDSKLVYSYSQNVHLIFDSEEVDVKIAMTNELSLESFDPFQYDESQYKISAPSCFEEVTKQTDITKPVELAYGDNYMKIYFEAGQYYYKVNAYSGSVNMDIFDMKKQEITQITDVQGYQHINETFLIYESGYYYVKATSYLEKGIVNFSSCDHENNFDLKNPSSFVSKVGKLEDGYDFEVFNISTTEVKVLKVTNTGEKDITILAPSLYSLNMSTFVIPAGQTELLKVYARDNCYILAPNSNKDGSYEGYNYSFTVDYVDDTYGSEGDFESADEITTSYGEKEYICGLGLKPKFAKLIITKRGYYTFEFEDKMEFRIYLTKYPSNEIVYSEPKGGYLLEPGNYLVELNADSYKLYHSKIRYQFFSVEDATYNVELPKTGSSYLQTKRFIEEQTVKYYFVLTESTTINFSSAYIHIYAKDNTLLSFEIGNSYNLDSYISLNAGEYYFEGPTILHSNLGIVISDGEKKELDYNNIREIEFNEEVSFSLDFQDQKVYFGKEINETIKVKVEVDQSSCIVFDANKNIVRRNDDEVYELSGGYYYFVTTGVFSQNLHSSIKLVTL